MGDEKIVSDYGGIEAIPTTFIIDRQGKVVTVHQGFTDNATFEAEIRPLL
jgi:peroxiredoxin